MPTYVAFLRAINLGAKRKFPKDAIRAAVEGAGGAEVATYINTGNVRLTSRLRSRARVEEVLEQAFLADRGFEVPTIAYPVEEFAAVARDAAELSGARPALERHYVLLLKDEPPPEVVDRVHGLSAGDHEVVVRGRAAHLLLGAGYEAGGVDPLKAEKHLGVATSRNRTVVTALGSSWCGLDLEVS